MKQAEQSTLTEGVYASIIVDQYERIVTGRKGVKQQKLIVVHEIQLRDGNPVHLEKDYEPMLDKGSELREDLRKLRGRDLDDAEMAEFDSSLLLNLPAQLLVKPLQRKKGEKCAEITAILKPSGQAIQPSGKYIRPVEKLVASAEASQTPMELKPAA